MQVLANPQGFIVAKSYWKLLSSIR